MIVNGLDGGDGVLGEGKNQGRHRGFSSGDLGLPFLRWVQREAKVWKTEGRAQLCSGLVLCGCSLTMQMEMNGGNHLCNGKAKA
jgi:hypothetical protein